MRSLGSYLSSSSKSENAVKAKVAECRLGDLWRITLPDTSVNRSKSIGHRTKLRPILGRATSCACAALERFQACGQVRRWRGGVVGVEEFVGIGLQVVEFL